MRTFLACVLSLVADPRWKDGDYYVFVYGDGRLVAHGYLVRK